jgi:hypothetical protein
MFLFYRLLLAHVIADFPLQTKQIFNIKMNTEWGVILHTFIVLIFSILFTFPYLENLKVIAVLLIIFLSHTVIDKLKQKYSKKANTPTPNLKIFLLDQVLHLSIIAVLTFKFTEKILLISPFNNVFISYLIHLYNSDIFIISLIGYIITVFFIPILLIYIKEEDVPFKPQKLNKQKIIKIRIPANKIVDKFYRLFLTLSAQYLGEQYTIVIFILFVMVSLISYQVSPERIEKVYNLKRIINTSLAIFIGVILKIV